VRKTHLAIAAVGLSAAAVTGSALTAENTIANTVAGYGESAITGAVVTEIDYVTLAADATFLDEVVFTTTTQLDLTAVTGNTATLTLKDGGSPLGTPIVCAIAPWSGTTHTITCDTPDTTQFGLVDAVGLTVSD
jgi:hypothetical protein